MYQRSPSTYNAEDEKKESRIRSSYFLDLLDAVVVYNPLQPLGRCLEPVDEDDVEDEAVEGRVSISLFLNTPPPGGNLFVDNSVSRSLGTLISNSLGTLFIKNDLTHGAILCVLGFL